MRVERGATRFGYNGRTETRMCVVIEQHNPIYLVGSGANEGSHASSGCRSYAKPGETVRPGGRGAYIEDAAGRLVRTVVVGKASADSYVVLSVEEHCAQ